MANPAKMDQYSGLKVGDDASDAGWIAEQMRLGILPDSLEGVWINQRTDWQRWPFLLGTA